ncbi:hypothetical protein H5T51_08965 [Candidatus Bathyarchaeota archaeon]|nr:hypothetical protein [Candidatus Bathyarchaeota archaeon]
MFLHLILERVLKSTPVMLLLAILIGLVFPQASNFFKDYVDLAMIIVLTISAMGIRIKAIFSANKGVKMMLVGLALNYVVLSALCILLGYLFFPQDVELRNGFAAMATVPVATAVVPFTHLLKGDVEYSMSITTLLYLSALILTPLLSYGLFGSAVNLWELIIVDVQLILLPLILSRILLLLKADRIPKGAYDVTINIALAVIVYAIIGVNQPTFFTGEAFISLILLAALIRTFGIGILTEKIATKAGVEKQLIPPITMLASIKNMALTSTLTLNILTPKSSLPAAICMPLEILFFIYLKTKGYS